MEEAHRQIRVKYGDLEGDVDEELAPLILELWKADMETFSSCQDAGESLIDLPTHLPHMATQVEADRGRAYIDFRWWEDVCAFKTMVANGGPRDTFYERLAHWCSPGAWTVVGICTDWPIDPAEEDFPRRPDPREQAHDGTRHSSFDFDGWQVQFPRSDIPRITEQFRTSRESGPVDSPGVPTWETVAWDDLDD